MPNKATAISRSSGDQAISALLFTAPDLATGKRAAIALSRIYAYLWAAHQQISRIEKFRGNAIPTKPSYSANMIQAYIHVHLYFVCWAAIGRMVEVIRRCSRLEAPKEISRKYRSALESYRKARDHFEHYEERLPGGKMSQKLPNPSDYGNLQNGYFSIGGYRWDVSEGSLKRLNSIVAELSAGISQEGTGRLKARLVSKLNK